MTTIEQLAEFVTGVGIDGARASVVDRLRLHLCDTIVAGLAGGKKPEAAAIVRMVEDMGTIGQVPALGVLTKTSSPIAALMGCVAIRCTEIDDIHIESCTTPGSVIVPTALALSYRKPPVDTDRFLAALLSGYEVMTRFGKAVDGPFILYKGIWPTYISSTLGATATAARMLGLSPEQTAHALAAAITMTTGTSARISGLSSRWLTLGCSVQSAITAALAAGQGYRGGLDMLGGETAELVGVAVDVAGLLEDLGTEFESGRVSIKPYCAAKQTTSAICAFVRTIDGEQIEPESIERVVVAVPTYYKKMIDHPETPRDAIGSIVSVQYQLALAAYHRDRLADTSRSPIYDDPEFRALTQKIVVEADTGLDECYPKEWPARVVVHTERGARAQEIRHAKGDPPDPFTWEEEIEKADRVLSS